MDSIQSIGILWSLYSYQLLQHTCYLPYFAVVNYMQCLENSGHYHNPQRFAGFMEGTVEFWARPHVDFSLKATLCYLWLWLKNGAPTSHCKTSSKQLLSRSLSLKTSWDNLRWPSHSGTTVMTYVYWTTKSTEGWCMLCNDYISYSSVAVITVHSANIKLYVVEVYHIHVPWLEINLNLTVEISL